ncbi:hypothetical protein EKG37_15780 [Robertmurraya yapensis]|uniref:STAS/SEC14 domain-containing protein n=2 Tax=Bacillaceae TaxID=186817 RepID=A0A3S0KF70_9BACI|nr:hypothetical protein [Bacillus yapensis]RTR29191.1 hypothetical protein EKG37_15780 [Bacillus yapensis]TKS94796.1 hypothetical protein FAR12_15780 [Bacillus yapensis]
MTKLYDINIDAEKKILFVKVSGFFQEEDSKLYVSEFQTAVNIINPANYTLIVDGRGQEAIEGHVMHDLKFALQLYSSANFKKIIIVNPIYETSKEQVECCVKEVNFKGEFVNSLEEAQSILKA